jgi:nicotinamide-nucleotide amidase
LSPAVNAGILAVGSELLGTDRLDTNSLRTTGLLERFGVDLVRKSIVGDDPSRIEAEMRSLLAETELVLVSGGLGPTADDVTREGCARALDRDLVESAEAWTAIERRFAAMGRRATENNRRQAQRIDGAELLWNPRGTAPGQRIDHQGKTLFLFPGVPTELEYMIDRYLAPWLTEHAPGGAREQRTLRVALRPESEVDERLEPVYLEFGRASVTVLASPGEVRVRLLATGAEVERRARLDEMAARVRDCLGASIYGEGEAISLEQVVGEELARRKLKIATAEACTGGLIAQRLTSVAGASGWFPGGVTAYSNDSKVAILAVDPAVIAERGAVSEEVARALARGARERLGADLGVGVTGIAGPDGGTVEKPVGTVHLAVAGPGETVAHRRLRLPGDRERIRRLASQAALEMVPRRLLELEEEP